MSSINNIQTKVPFNVAIIGAGIGGLAAATVSFFSAKSSERECTTVCELDVSY